GVEGAGRAGAPPARHARLPERERPRRHGSDGPGAAAGQGRQGGGGDGRPVGGAARARQPRLPQGRDAGRGDRAGPRRLRQAAAEEGLKARGRTDGGVLSVAVTPASQGGRASVASSRLPIPKKDCPPPLPELHTPAEDRGGNRWGAVA